MDVNELLNGLTLFLVSVLVMTQTSGIGDPFEMVVGVVAYVGVVVPPSYLVAGVISDRMSA